MCSISVVWGYRNGVEWVLRSHGAGDTINEGMNEAPTPYYVVRAQMHALPGMPSHATSIQATIPNQIILRDYFLNINAIYWAKLYINIINTRGRRYALQE